MSGTQKQFSRMTTIEKNKIEINSQKQMRNEVEGARRGWQALRGREALWQIVADCQ